MKLKESWYLSEIAETLFLNIFLIKIFRKNKKIDVFEFCYFRLVQISLVRNKMQLFKQWGLDGSSHTMFTYQGAIRLVYAVLWWWLSLSKHSQMSFYGYSLARSKFRVVRTMDLHYFDRQLLGLNLLALYYKCCVLQAGFFQSCSSCPDWLLMEIEPYFVLCCVWWIRFTLGAPNRVFQRVPNLFLSTCQQKCLEDNMPMCNMVQHVYFMWNHKISSFNQSCWVWSGDRYDHPLECEKGVKIL